MLGLALAAVALGAAGVAFGYWILLPRAVHFLTNYDNTHFHVAIRASSYYNFVVTVLVGVVIVFQTPLVVLGLVSLGVLSSRTLRQKRRLGYFITAAVALALPGPDPVTTFLELLPMWLLFEGSIWLACSVRAPAGKASPGLGYPGRLMARAAVKAKQQADGEGAAVEAGTRAPAGAQRRRQPEPGSLLRPPPAPPEVGLRAARRRLRAELRRSSASAPATVAA